MILSKPRLALAFLLVSSMALALGAPAAHGDPSSTPESPMPLQVYYLEFVTPDVDATCDLLAQTHGVEFGDPVPALGNARTAPRDGGGWIGVRAPMRETEEPVVRPYRLVDDLDAAVEKAAAAGAEIALPGMDLPGWGRCAIYLQGGLQHGLWQR